MQVEYQCAKCRAINTIPEKREGGANSVCQDCGGQLTPAPQNEGNGDTSMAVGFLGVATLGAAIGGIPGAIIGGIVGAVAGKMSKGLG